MWFAALGSYQYNPWFISLVDKLLENKEDVLALLSRNPFPDKAPRFIRSILYTYHYTKLPRNTSSLSDGLAISRLLSRASLFIHSYHYCIITFIHSFILIIIVFLHSFIHSYHYCIFTFIHSFLSLLYYYIHSFIHSYHYCIITFIHSYL